MTSLGAFDRLQNVMAMSWIIRPRFDVRSPPMTHRMSAEIDVQVKWRGLLPDRTSWWDSCINYLTWYRTWCGQTRNGSLNGQGLSGLIILQEAHPCGNKSTLEAVDRLCRDLILWQWVYTGSWLGQKRNAVWCLLSFGAWLSWVNDL